MLKKIIAFLTSSTDSQRAGAKMQIPNQQTINQETVREATKERNEVMREEERELEKVREQGKEKQLQDQN